MMEKTDDGVYLSLDAFLADINLIANNAKEYNPLAESFGSSAAARKRGRKIVSDAIDMQDVASAFVHNCEEQLGWGLFARCKEIEASRTSQSISQRRSRSATPRDSLASLTVSRTLPKSARLSGHARFAYGAAAAAAAAAGEEEEEEIVWQTQGSEYVGMRVMRSFAGAGVPPAAGTITKWAEESAPGELDELWHMVHDDGDEEDLERYEVKAAVALEQSVNKIEWRTSGSAFIGQRAMRTFAGTAPTFESRIGRGVITKWAAESAPGANDELWHMVHDDGDSEDLELLEVKAALALEQSSGAGGRAARSARRHSRTSGGDALAQLPSNFRFQKPKAKPTAKPAHMAGGEHAEAVEDGASTAALAEATVAPEVVAAAAAKEEEEEKEGGEAMDIAAAAEVEASPNAWPYVLDSFAPLDGDSGVRSRVAAIFDAIVCSTDGLCVSLLPRRREVPAPRCCCTSRSPHPSDRLLLPLRGGPVSVPNPPHCLSRSCLNEIARTRELLERELQRCDGTLRSYRQSEMVGLRAAAAGASGGAAPSDAIDVARRTLAKKKGEVLAHFESVANQFASSSSAASSSALRRC